MSVTMVLAISRNGVIGIDNKIPWHLPNDFKHFKELTLNKIILMGRSTWESLPVKPLKNRENWVLSRNPEFKPEGARVFSRFEDAIANREGRQLCIIGGQKVYDIGLLFADTIELTIVNHEFQGDRFFKKCLTKNWNVGWKLVNQRDFVVDEIHKYPYSFLTYQRRSSL